MSVQQPSADAYQHRVELARDALRTLSRSSPRPPSEALRSVRPDVLASWQRSLEAHRDPQRVSVPFAVPTADLDSARRQHALAAALPVIRTLLIDPAADAGLITALGNADGHLLWVEGDELAARRAELMGFVPGADWSEASVGTAAPGAALATGRPSQISRAEHFSPLVHPWSCSAMPVRNPATGEIVGVIDVTGGDDAVSPLAFSLLRATVTAVESLWRNQLTTEELHTDPEHGLSLHQMVLPLSSPASSLARPPAPRPGRAEARGAARPLAAPTSSTTPPPAAVIHVTGQLPPRVSRRELSLRHAEILTLLDWHSAGLDGAALEELLYGEAAPGVESRAITLRAEIHRLRRALSSQDCPLAVSARPYRLDGEIRTDAALARESLRDGDVQDALAAAVGPVLPHSDAPGIVQIREELAGALREAVLQDADATQLWHYLTRPEAADDEELWLMALRLLPAESPRRSLVVSTLERLRAQR
ncbi:GAF domain-containing protein [Citricoccus muralis]|uniref:GAF domain-containing protein n=1 Tax=Citricoccus muralis TaxID=169134 RepID=A0ABY8H6W6_9MICC|nr:GAF domain-containing protein [Citricoccus muralis]WFP16398.1 GAF domain-containing protein [Citricoccus muralis]